MHDVIGLLRNNLHQQMRGSSLGQAGKKGSTAYIPTAAC
jgi:hypothetical protein